MNDPAPFVICQWMGDSFVPTQRFRAECDRHFVIGELYEVQAEVKDEISAKTRGHYFATLKEGYLNLPEAYAGRWATPEHMRKWLLIRAGYRDERTIQCATKAEAQRMAAFIRPLDEFAVVVAREATVIVATAKSQSKGAMGRKAFQESKQKVLDALADILGVDTGALSTAGEQTQP